MRRPIPVFFCALLAGAFVAGTAFPVMGAPASDTSDRHLPADGDILNDSSIPMGERKDKVTKRPRYDADLTGGEIMLVEPIWIPVKGAHGTVRYVGVRVHFFPEDGKIADACYALPWVTEALVVHFATNPLTANPGEGDAALNGAVLKVSNSLPQGRLFKDARLTPIDGTIRAISESDRALSLACS